MSLDDSSSFFVADSEVEDDSFDIIFSPHFICTSASESPTVNKAKPSQVDPDLTALDIQLDLHASGQSVGDETSINFGHRPYLRKRKAIQKLPYSLDRIKHKQLLQGYDVSRFDAVSEEVEFLKNVLASRVEERNIQEVEAGSPGWIGGENSDVESEEDTASYGGKVKVTPILEENNISDGDVDLNNYVATSQEKREELENQILFRGRLLNIKTGYRGVLPRMAWEKSMKKNQAMPATRKRALPQNRKGLAKRKTVNGIQRNQDKELLNDLIVTDEESVEEDRDVSFSNTHSISNHQYQGDAAELQRMSAYYQSKYLDESSSDSSPDEDDCVTIDPETFIAPEESSIKEISGNRSSINISEAQVRDFFSDDYPAVLSSEEGSAKEDDRGNIIAMLTRQVSSSKNTKLPQISKGRKPRKYRYRKSSDIRKQLRNNVKTAKISVRNTASKCSSEPVSISDGSIQMLENNKVCEKNDLRMKAKNKYFGMFPEPESDHRRSVKTFTTIIEGVSHKYVVPTRRDHTSSPIAESDSPKFGGNGCKHYLKALDSLLDANAIESPDFAKICLSEEEFTLSRLGGSDVCQSLTNIFDHIIDKGVSNTELISLNESLTIFLLHLNKIGVYHPISDFHRKFRSKVKSLRHNAKPIHFYQIAVCQVMFLEISKYSTASSSFKMEIESKILDHIVSFFKLLSVCHDPVLKVDLEYLHRACDIIAIVVQIMGANEVLWKRLEQESFPVDVSFVLVDVFPTSVARWNIAQLENDYDTMRNAMTFINYCVQRHEWRITKEVILSLDKILKKRRFEDFAAEEKASGRNKVAYKRMQFPKAETIFNNYLHLLSSIKLTDALVERIVPMGDISSSDSIFVLINRLNLIIVLSQHSDLNSDKRFDELIRPVIRSDLLSLHNVNSLTLIAESVLNGVLCLFEISCDKKTAFKAHALISIYKSLISRNRDLERIWNTFLERLNQSIGVCDRHSLIFLKTMYPCFPLMCHTQSQSKHTMLLLQIYLKNLSVLGAQWIQAHLFQAVQGVVQETGSWIDQYCAIAKFLIDNNVMSWWSFFLYNSVKRSLSVQHYFNYKITQLCDPQSFDLIKKSLFEIATDQILEERGPSFIKFVTQLISREKGTDSELVFGSYIGSVLFLLRPLVSALSKLSYNDMILRLVSKIRALYQDGGIDIELTTRMLNFFNVQFVDQVKDSHDFLLLKRELGISDREAEKSSFRDVFKSYGETVSQVCYIEKGLVHSSTTAFEIANYLDKLKSLFSFQVLSDPFHFFVSIVEAHLVKEIDEVFHLKIRIAAHYLRLINEILVGRFRQVTAEEFLELCRLYKLICRRTPLTELLRVSGADPYAYENVRLQIIVIEIAQGFIEYDLLVKQSKYFLEGTYENASSEQGELSHKISEIVRQTVDPNRPATFEEKEPEYNELRRIIVMTEQRKFTYA